MKHSYDKKLKVNKEPVRFDFFVIEKEMIQNMISGMDRFQSMDIKSMKEKLENSGLSKSLINTQIQQIENKIKEDEKLLKLLKLNKNITLNYSQENSKISDFWDSENVLSYELKIKK